MKGTNVLISIILGISCYLIINFFYGSLGFHSLHELQENNEKLARNLDEITAQQEKLLKVLDSLKSNTEEIRLQARRIGFFDKREQLVRLEGYRSAHAAVSPGKRIPVIDPPQSNEVLLRALALSMGLLYLLVSSLMQWKK
jgi:cell division protein FtsB